MVITNNGERVIRRLYEITKDYDLGFDVQIQELLTMGLERFDLDIAILARIEDGLYTVEHCVVPDGVELTSGVEFDFDITYCHITCNAQAPVAIENVGKHDTYASHPAYQSFGLESYIGIPIRINGKLYGTLNFSSPDAYPRAFQDVDIDVLQLMASWIEVELIRRQQEQELKELNEKLVKKAYEDSLTEIPNRRAMFKHLNKEINRMYRSQGQACLVLMDIDFFKKINDQYGHQMGDDVLFAVANAISHAKRDYDYVARFGGEEFLLWLPGIDVNEATSVCERIQQAVRELALVDNQVTLSFGMTNYHVTTCAQTDHSDNKGQIDILIAEADNALYQAKENGRDRIEVFAK